MIGGFALNFYRGPESPQQVGTVFLETLTADMLVELVNDGALIGVTSLGILASFLPLVVAEPNLTATGTNQATALPLPGSFCIFTSVPLGSGTIIPQTAVPGSVFDIWNADPANALDVYPLLGMQIQNFGANIPAQVVAGGSVRIAINSLTQAFAR